MRRLITSALLLAATSACADNNFFIQGGHAKGASRITLGYTFDAGASIFALTLHPEVSVSRWSTRDGSRSWDISIVPMLRYKLNQRLYLEGGIGASYFNNHNFAGQSTSFQFADHLGIVYGPIGLRISHFSNAGIKKPNPGVDSLQLTYKLGF